MIQKAIHELVENKNLDFETTKEVMDEIMSGNATQAQISSFLTALRMKGETIDEITACATVMRDKAVKLSPPFPVMDIVGTGGTRWEPLIFPPPAHLWLPPEAYGWQNMETAAYPVRAARQMCWKDWGQSWL